MSDAHERVRLDPRFWAHVRIEPSSCPGGIVFHLVDGEGELVHEQKIGSPETTFDLAMADVKAFTEARERSPGRLYLYVYDGDSGECVQTLVFEP